MAPPRGPNDPDNPDAKRNQPTKSAPSTKPAKSKGGGGGLGPGGMPTSVKPGLQPGEKAQDYDWWMNGNPATGEVGNNFWVSELEKMNPGREEEVRALAWTFRNDYVALANNLERGGFNIGGGGNTNGGGSRGGGGGGGAATAEDYAAASAAVRNRSRMLGLELSDEQINGIGKQVVDGKWSSDMLDDYLVPTATNTNNPGFITATVNQVQQLAGQQLIKVSDATAREWASRVASGEMDLAGVQSLLQAQAAAKYTWAASQIGQGITVRDMLLPARDRLASELEMQPESIDLMDDKWSGMMQTVDQNGQTRAATDSEITMKARKLPEWKNTQRAAQSVAEYAMTIREYFGG
jgi:hypothetical protein